MEKGYQHVVSFDGPGKQPDSDSIYKHEPPFCQLSLSKIDRSCQGLHGSYSDWAAHVFFCFGRRKMAGMEV